VSRQRINLLACEPVDNSGEHRIIVVSSESYVRLIIHTLCASFAADTVYRDLPAFLPQTASKQSDCSERPKPRYGPVSAAITSIPMCSRARARARSARAERSEDASRNPELNDGPDRLLLVPAVRVVGGSSVVLFQPLHGSATVLRRHRKPRGHGCDWDGVKSVQLWIDPRETTTRVGVCPP